MKTFLTSAFLLLSVWAWAQSDPRSQGSAASRPSLHHSAKKQLIGRSAPDFELPTPDGGRIRLSYLRGKVVLLNFWATFCATSKVEMPLFAQLQSEYGEQGFQVVGVALDDTSADDIATFATEMGVNYPILIGNESVAKNYGDVPVLPTTFFLDQDGKIIAREFGLQNRDVYVGHIKRALGQAVQAQK